MTFGKLLQKDKDAVAQRWLEGLLATYPEESSAAFRRRKDPFANPVGHGLRLATRGIVEALSGGTDAGEIRRHLREILRIRAVQEFSASRAVCFVFDLKEAVRAELGTAARDPRFASELEKLDREIDQIALAAFDVFVECREQVYELRVNEVKRTVSWVAERINRREIGPEPAPVNPQ